MIFLISRLSLYYSKYFIYHFNRLLFLTIFNFQKKMFNIGAIVAGAEKAEIKENLRREGFALSDNSLEYLL